MAFKLVVLCATLAYANAGLIPAPVAYSSAADVSHAYISSPVAVAHAAPVAIHAPAVGTSQQNVFRSYGGNAAISTYSKAVDSAFSSVRKYDTRITNDGLSLAPVATYAHAAPVATYAQAAPLATYAHAAPVATYAQVAPLATYAHAAPVATYAHAAPVATYAQAAPVAAYASAPVVAKAAVAYSPAVAVSHMTFSGLGVNYAW